METCNLTLHIILVLQCVNCTSSGKGDEFLRKEDLYLQQVDSSHKKRFYLFINAVRCRQYFTRAKNKDQGEVLSHLYVHFITLSSEVMQRRLKSLYLMLNST